LSKLLFYASAILFKACLDYSYVNILSKEFQSVGYHLNFEIVRYLTGWILYVLSFFLLNHRFEKIKDYFFLTAILSVITPILVLWGLDTDRPSYPVFISCASIITVYASYKLIWMYGRLALPYVIQGREIAVFISVLLVIFLVAWYYISGVTFNLDITKVYSLREENEELAGFGFFAYLNNWIYKVFAVYLLAFLLMRKNYLLSLLMILVFIFYFAANTHKAVLLTPFLVLSTWFYFKKFNSLFIVPLGFSIIVLLSIISYYFVNDIWMSALFPNRVFGIPAHLTFKYFEFFSKNDFIYFSNSFFSNLIDYPYDLGLSKLIGKFDGTNSNANNGYISSAYAQGGASVALVYSVIIGFILTLIDNSVKNNGLPLWFCLVVFMVPMRDLIISADLMTTMLTGGMIWSILLILLSRRRCNN
tara:strand:+ start:20906 stop:22159 length:1254 start_codon:yes stop_codon:yes gene_type:complete